VLHVRSEECDAGDAEACAVAYRCAIDPAMPAVVQSFETILPILNCVIEMSQCSGWPSKQFNLW
jgi:hypothetical protein